MKKKNKYAVLGLRVLERAAEQAAENARRHGSKVPVWKNNTITFKTPENAHVKSESDNRSTRLTVDYF